VPMSLWGMVRAPSCATTISRAMARPSPVPPMSRARVVETSEPLEHPRALIGRDTGAVVSDCEVDTHIGLVELYPDHADRVTFGVFQQVANDAAEAVVVADHLASRHTVEVYDDSTARLERASFFEYQVIEIDALAAQRQSSGVASGENEEVVYEPLHPSCFVEDVLLGRFPLRALRVGEVDFELRADRGERASQLV
jgi:hypothetical protein